MKLNSSFICLMLYPFVARAVHMPGKNRSKRDLELDESQAQLKERLKLTVDVLAGVIGERNSKRYEGLQNAEKFIVSKFEETGLAVCADTFKFDGVAMHNIEAQKLGTIKANEIVVIGAHYDTVFGSPGADDNATGVAAMVEISRVIAQRQHKRTVRFLAFANEENQNGVDWETMGSANYAGNCRSQNDNVVAMFSLEMLGCYSDEPDSQKYPNPFNLFYPSVGNFIAFVGKVESGDFVRKCIKKFRQVSKVPSEGLAAPQVFRDIHRSEHWGFWQHGFDNALMVTDTSNYRNKHYHDVDDVPETIDFDRLTLVTSALTEVVEQLLNE